MKVDNHMLETADACLLKYKKQIIDGYVPRFKGAALLHGIAVHAGLAEWYRGSMEGLSLTSRVERAVNAIKEAWSPDHPADDYRTLPKAQELMIEYIKKFPQESWTPIAVESPFCLPLGHDESGIWFQRYLPCRYSEPFTETCGSDELPDDFTSTCPNCGRQLEQIEYGGIIDLIAQFGSGRHAVVYIVDHKTTSQMGSTYFLQFKPNSQICGYCWGGSNLSDRQVQGAIINALCLTSGGNIKFSGETRQMFSFFTEDFLEWEADVYAKCIRIRQAQVNNHWDKSTHMCQTKYGMCGYHGLHILASEEDRQRRRDVDYVIQKWDFENRDE